MSRSNQYTEYEVIDGRVPFVMISEPTLALWSAPDTTLKPSHLMVFLHLLRYANHATRKAWPSVRTIADDTRLSRPTVIDAIKHLEAAGLLQIEKVRAATGFERSVYTILEPSEKSNRHRSKNPTHRGQKSLAAEGKNLDPNQTNMNQIEMNQIAPPEATPPVETVEERATDLGTGTPKPIDLIEAFMRASGQPMPVSKGRAFGSAKTLVTAGVTPDEVERCTRWIATQDWARERGFDFGTLLHQIDRWRQIDTAKAAHREAKPHQISGEARAFDPIAFLASEHNGLDDDQLARLASGAVLDDVLTPFQRQHLERERILRASRASMVRSSPNYV